MSTQKRAGRNTTKTDSKTAKTAEKTDVAVIPAKPKQDSLARNASGPAEVNIEDILNYGDVLVKAKQRLEYFDRKLAMLKSFQDKYDVFASNNPDEVFGPEETDEFSCALNLEWSDGTSSAYGKKKEEILSIKNPHILNVFATQFKNYIEGKRKVAYEQILQYDKQYKKE